MNAVLLLALLCSPARAQVEAVETVDASATEAPLTSSLAGNGAELEVAPISEEAVPLLVVLHPWGMPARPLTRQHVERVVQKIHPGAAVSASFAGARRPHLLVLAPNAEAAGRIQEKLTRVGYDVARLDGMLKTADRAFISDQGPADPGRALFDLAKAGYDSFGVPTLDDAGLGVELARLTRFNALEDHARTMGLVIARIRPTTRRAYSPHSLRRASEALEHSLDSFLAAVELMGPGATGHPDVQAANRLIALGYAALHEFRGDLGFHEALGLRVGSAIVLEARRSDRFANNLLYAVHQSLDDGKRPSPTLVGIVRSILQVIAEHSREAWIQMLHPWMPSLDSVPIPAARVSLPTLGYAHHADAEVPPQQAGQAQSF